ncbi:hypothetical protein EDD18DRAFT_1188316, partial [Armillaria luteobubalina]
MNGLSSLLAFLLSRRILSIFIFGIPKGPPSSADPYYQEIFLAKKPRLLSRWRHLLDKTGILLDIMATAPARNEDGRWPKR